MPQGAEGERLARLHGHPPELDPAQGGQHLLHEVVVPHGDPTAGDDGVGIFGRAGQRVGQFRRVVTDDP